jgi:hypothetical protein
VCSEKIGLLQQLAKSLMSDYVPDHQMDLLSVVGVSQWNDHLFFRYLGPNGANIFVIELIEYESLYQTGLADTTLPD